MVRPQSRNVMSLWPAAGVSLGLLAVCGIVGGLAPLGADEAKAAKTVSLIVDYNDGIEKHFTKIDWKPKMTVLDALQAAARSKHGLTFKSTGNGLTAFVTQIDDVANEGGGGSAKNWVFRINDRLSPRGAGTAELSAGDRVNWKHTVYEP